MHLRNGSESGRSADKVELVHLPRTGDQKAPIHRQHVAGFERTRGSPAQRPFKGLPTVARIELLTYDQVQLVQ